MASGTLPVANTSKHGPEIIELESTRSAEGIPVTADVESQPTQTVIAPNQDELYSAFSKKQRIFIVVMTTLGAIISPISGAIYFPALNVLADDFHVSYGQISLTITTYMIFQGLTPMFVGSFADNTGHRPAFLVCSTVYVIANIALASQNSYAALLVLRMLQSAGASGTIALRNGVLASIFTPAERGSYLGFVTAANLWAPAFGPLVGGALVEGLGWRSIFWGLAIVTFAYTVIYALFVPETNRKIVGNGSIPPQQWWNKTVLQIWRDRSRRPQPDATKDSGVRPKHKIHWPNPIKTLIMYKEPDIAIMLGLTSIYTSGLYLVMASLPLMYTATYNLTVIQVSLCYIPLGLGAAVGSVLNGRVLNYSWKRVAIAHNFPTDRKRAHDLRHFPIEKARLQIVAPMVLTGAAVFIGYGWAIKYHANLAVPLVLGFIGGMTVISSASAFGNLAVDCYPESPSAVTAAGNLSRCLVGAGATAVITPMLQGIGDGWAWTIVGSMYVIVSPLLWVLIKYGPRWREKRAVRTELKKEKELERKREQETRK